LPRSGQHLESLVTMITIMNHDRTSPARARAPSTLSSDDDTDGAERLRLSRGLLRTLPES
jgi:hypothetical protein